MLTTEDLYTRLGYEIDVGDRVRFKLMRGLELKTPIEPFVTKGVKKSSNRNANRTFIGTITNYQPTKPGDLDIEGKMEDGYSFRLRLNQCRDLQILE